MTTHDKKSLAALKRRELIELAISSSVATSSAAHSTKSAKLIRLILAAQPKTVPVEVAVPAGGPHEVTDVETVLSAESSEPADNIEQFSPAPEQTEMPATVEPQGDSKGIFKIDRLVLVRQLAACAKVLSSKQGMPILNCVLISIGAGRCRVEATSLDIHVVTQVPTETTGEFSLAVPFNVLAKFVGRCSSEFLMAEAKGFRLYLSDLENRTEIMCLSGEEFPPAHAPSIKFESLFEIATDRVVAVINETLKFASTDAARYLLNGVFVDLRKPEPVMVATDGHRCVRVALGATSVSEISDKEEGGKLIVPSRAAEALRSSIPRSAVANFYQSQNRRVLSVRSEHNGLEYHLTANLVEGNYPNYEQVIPKETRPKFVVNSAALLAVLGRITVLNTEKSNSVKLTFTKGVLKVQAASADVGHGVETLTVEGDGTGAEILIALNPKFIADTLNSWSDETVTLAPLDVVSPILFTAPGKTAVVMPVRLT